MVVTANVTWTCTIVITGNVAVFFYNRLAQNFLQGRRLPDKDRVDY